MKIIKLIPIVAVLISGCRGCNDNKEGSVITKTDTVTQIETHEISPPPPPDSGSKPVEKKPEIPAIETNPAVKSSKDPGVLAKIDQYLVSTSAFTPANGGISNASISVKNTLSNAGFQKVILEVTILKDDNSLVSTDYYTMVNIEPGETKQMPIPNKSQGSKIVIHVVKVKSVELTNGESVMTGIHYNPL